MEDLHVDFYLFVLIIPSEGSGSMCRLTWINMLLNYASKFNSSLWFIFIVQIFQNILWKEVILSYEILNQFLQFYIIIIFKLKA